MLNRYDIEGIPFINDGIVKYARPAWWKENQITFCEYDLATDDAKLALGRILDVCPCKITIKRR
jgi:hypothetical protein